MNGEANEGPFKLADFGASGGRCLEMCLTSFAAGNVMYTNFTEFERL